MRLFPLLIVFLLSTSTVSLAAGAIAVNDEVGIAAGNVGYGIGQGTTQDLAGNAALEICGQANRDGGCEVKVRYDRCGAYASSLLHSGTGTGASKEEASATALDRCGRNCKLVVADCANAE